MKKEDIAIAELEYLGLSLRVINSLEDSKYNLVYLDDLLMLSKQEISLIPNIGKSGVKQIFDAIENISHLDEKKNALEFR